MDKMKKIIIMFFIGAVLLLAGRVSAWIGGSGWMAGGDFNIYGADIAIWDDTPHLEFVDVDDDSAFQFHYDTDSTAAPWQGLTLFKGTNDGSGFNQTDTIANYDTSGGIHFPMMKTGSNQSAAGAVAGELWADSSDSYVVKLGQ